MAFITITTESGSEYYVDTVDQSITIKDVPLELVNHSTIKVGEKMNFKYVEDGYVKSGHTSTVVGIEVEK